MQSVCFVCTGGTNKELREKGKRHAEGSNRSGDTNVTESLKVLWKERVSNELVWELLDLLVVLAQG